MRVPSTKDSDSGTPIADLISRARQGSVAALGQILDDCRPYLLLLANQEMPTDLQGKVSPSDLVQETFVRACQEYGGFRGQSEEELRGWLRRILLNKIADQTRQFCQAGKRAVDRERQLADVPTIARDLRVLNEEESPSDQAILAEQLRQLRQAVERLPEASRQLIRWRNVERLTFREIGDRLGSSADAARKAWARAIEQVQLPGMNHEHG
jgi:RNA polymerase sigma-70 factor (ECF subfamily)